VATGFSIVASGLSIVATGFQIVATGFQIVASGFQIVASGFQIVATGFQIVTTGFQIVASGFGFDPIEIRFAPSGFGSRNAVSQSMTICYMSSRRTHLTGKRPKVLGCWVVEEEQPAGAAPRRSRIPGLSVHRWDALLPVTISRSRASFIQGS
jgi:hypothetical protein